MDTIYDTGITERYIKIYEAMKDQKKFFELGMTFRHCALAAQSIQGDPAMVAQKVRSVSEVLRKNDSFFSNMPIGELRPMIAALLIKYNDKPEPFMATLEEVKPLFKEAKLGMGYSYAVIAAFILRQHNGQRSITASQVDRMAAIYREMKKHHVFLTGPDDYPFAAFLSTQKGDVETIINRVESIYNALVDQGYKKRDPLQLASHMLYVSDRRPEELARRFRTLADNFRRSKIRIFTTDYDELALLSFLEQRPDTIVRCVLAIRERLKVIRPRMDSETSFAIASSLGFLELVERSQSTQEVADVAAMLAAELMIVGQNVAMLASYSGGAGY